MFSLAKAEGDMTEPKSAHKEPQGRGEGWGDPLFLLGMGQRAFESWSRGAGAFTSEIVNFAQSRLQEDMSAWSRLMECKQPADALECQRQFAQKMASDYAEEAGKLTRLMTQVATDSFSAYMKETAPLTTPKQIPRAAE
jgi:hypothetical protein